jgi:hypothetical protein
VLDTVPAGAGGAICHEITAQFEELALFTSPHAHIIDRNVETYSPDAVLTRTSTFSTHV